MVLFSANENDNLSILTHHSQQAELATLALKVLRFPTAHAHLCSHVPGAGLKDPGTGTLTTATVMKQ